MTNQPRRDGGSLYTRAGERKYLTPGERNRFLAAAWRCKRADLRTLALTLAMTGCRISEALAMTTRSIEAEGGFISLRSLKRRNGAVVIREVPVPDSLVQELDRTHDLVASEPTACLWRLSRSRAWELIKALMAEAHVAPGIHATPKGLRHGFGIHAIRSGVSLNLLQRWLGHASIATTTIYAQAMGEEEREIAARMWRDSSRAPALITERLPVLASWAIAPDLLTPNGIIESGFMPSLWPQAYQLPALPNSFSTPLAHGRWRWVLVQVS